MSKGHLTGMAGVYLVAAELTLRDFIVSPTSRGAQAADLLISDESCTKNYSIQVKTNRSTFGYWLMSEKCMTLKSEHLIYILVNIKEKKKEIEYFVIPSSHVAKKIVMDLASVTKRKHTTYTLYRKNIVEYQNKWDLL